MSQQDRSEELGLDGSFREAELPLLIQRRGLAQWQGGVVRILDRRLLPHDIEHVTCHRVEEVAQAIEKMVIQGAFSLGLAGAYGLALTFTESGAPPARDKDARRQALRRAAHRLKETRKTGLFLARLIDESAAKAEAAIDAGEDPAAAIVAHVDQISADVAARAHETGRVTSSVVEDGDRILTHCFADRAFLYTLLEVWRQGKQVKVFCSETRPYLQGARLTSFSVQQIGFPATLISDNMGGFCLSQGLVNKLMTAADRVAMDGTICNKVGTYQYAVCAHESGVPFYVIRNTGPDPETKSAADIHVEFRNPRELLEFAGHPIAAPGVDALYPAFDITPPRYITAITTDRGIFKPERTTAYFGGEKQ